MTAWEGQYCPVGREWHTALSVREHISTDQPNTQSVRGGLITLVVRVVSIPGPVWDIAYISRPAWIWVNTGRFVAARRLDAAALAWSVPGPPLKTLPFRAFRNPR